MHCKTVFLGDSRKHLWTPNSNTKRNLVFGDYLKHCLKQIRENISILQILVIHLTKKEFSEEHSKKLLEKIDSYPAFRTLLYSQFFMNYQIIRNGTTPKEDKFTDSLQWIGASYCSAIISNDGYLLDTLSKNIHPYIQPISIKSLAIPQSLVIE